MDKVQGQKLKVIPLIKSLLFAYIISGLLLFLLAFLMLKLDLSGAIVAGGIVVIYILSCFIGGFLMGKNTDSGMLGGMLS